MSHWIHVEEGAYDAVEAFLVSPSLTGVKLHDAVMEVYTDQADERRVRGSGMAVNALLVELLEDHDDIDLLMDLGGQFKYILKTPAIMGGKVFTPGVKSIIRYIARSPVRKLPEAEYDQIRTKLVLLDEGPSPQ